MTHCFALAAMARLVLTGRFKGKVQGKQDKINKKRALTARFHCAFSFSS